MKICDFFCYEKNWLGEYGKCYGTKECEPCSCNGDMSKCDFYEEVRNKALQEDGYTVENLIKILKRYPSDMGVRVLIGNKIRPLSTITTGVDMDSNKTFVWLAGDENI